MKFKVNSQDTSFRNIKSVKKINPTSVKFYFSKTSNQYKLTVYWLILVFQPAESKISSRINCNHAPLMAGVPRVLSYGALLFRHSVYFVYCWHDRCWNFRNFICMLMICKFTKIGLGISSQSVFGRWPVVWVRFLSGLVLIFLGWILHNSWCCRSTEDIYSVLFRHFFLVMPVSGMPIKGCNLITSPMFLTHFWDALCWLISIGIFMFSLVIGGRPLYLFEPLVFSWSEKTLRIISLNQFTEYMVGSVLARRFRIWRFLSVAARSFSSLQDFKRVVREFFHNTS
jgi:hypothetical protein